MVPNGSKRVRIIARKYLSLEKDVQMESLVSAAGAGIDLEEVLEMVFGIMMRMFFQGAVQFVIREI